MAYVLKKRALLAFSWASQHQAYVLQVFKNATWSSLLFITSPGFIGWMSRPQFIDPCFFVGLDSSIHYNPWFMTPRPVSYTIPQDKEFIGKQNI